MNIDFSVILAQLPDLLRAAGVTLLIWLVGSMAAVVFGFLVTIGSRYGSRFVSLPLRVYVEVIRGTPFLIQLFLLYYGGRCQPDCWAWQSTAPPISARFFAPALKPCRRAT
jgi:polar amino acid transport system permease protein